MEKIIKLLVLTPLKIDSTSLYRAFGVFGDLSAQMGGRLQIIDRDQFSWPDIATVDLAFIQRPYSGQHLQMVQYIKEMGVPLWLDYDDNLFEITAANAGAYEVYSQQDIKNNMATMIAAADVVSVSTAELKRTYSKLNNNIVVIPNAFNDRILHYRDIDHKKQKNTVLWRGGSSHFIDLSQFSHEILTASNKFNNWQFVFFGYMPWFLDPKKPNIKYLQSQDPIIYYRTIHTLAPRVMIVPLEDIHFNHCKSNIAYIEGIFSGAAVLAPDWEEWHQPGCINYKNYTDFGDKLNSILKGQHDTAELNRAGWENITGGLSLSQINKKRIDLINNLLNK